MHINIRIEFKVDVPVMLKPKKNTRAVKALTDPRDIARLKKYLQSQLRNFLLCEIALETGLPAKQLLQLKVRDLLEAEPVDNRSHSADKTPISGAIAVGPGTKAAFERYSKEVNPDKDDFLFRSRKGHGPLTISSASRMVNKWFEDVGIEGMSGLLSLRKSRESFMSEQSGPEENAGPPGGDEYRPNPIQTLTAQEQVYRELEGAILTGRLKPGQRLVAEELSRQMGVSRIPIREAIGKLEARYFVQKTPQKGAVVMELSESNIKEIQELRLMLEIRAARQAIGHITDNTLKKLLNYNRQYTEAWERFDADALLSANKLFHYTMYQESGMPILMRLIDSVWNLLSPYYHIIFRQTRIKDPRSGPEHHERIIDGIRKKDTDQVECWLKKDLEDSSKFVIQVIKSFGAET